MCAQRILRTSFLAGLGAAVLAAALLVQPAVAHAAVRGPAAQPVAADEVSDTVVSGAATTAPAAVGLAPWQVQLHERTKYHQLWWILPSAILDGGGRAIWWTLGSVYGPAILVGTLAVQTVEGCGVLAAQSSLRLIHRWIDQAKSPRALSTRLKRHGWSWFGVSMGALALGWTLLGVEQLTWEFGFAIGAAVSWLLVFPFLHPAITFLVAAVEARRVAEGHVFHRENTEQTRRRRPRPEVRGFSPLGITVVW